MEEGKKHLIPHREAHAVIKITETAKPVPPEPRWSRPLAGLTGFYKQDPGETEGR